MNRLATDKRTAVIAALVEGVSINATCRMTGVAKHTVLKLLKDMGCAAAAYHNDHVRNLRVRRVQADEIWAFVYGKDKNLTMEQVQAGAGSVWTWTALDADTKLIIFLHARGSRRGDSASIYGGCCFAGQQPNPVNDRRPSRVRGSCRRCVRRRY
jgi:hypothetical protein